MVCLQCAFSHMCSCNTHTHPQRGPSGTPRKTGCSKPGGGGKIRQGGQAGAQGLDRDTEAGPGIRATGWDQGFSVTRQLAPSLAHPEHWVPPRALPECVGAYTEVHSHFIRHSPNLDSPQAHQQANVVYPRSGILLDHEKGQATGTRTGTEEPQRHHAERRKPDTGENVLHGSTHTKCKSRRKGHERTSRGDGNGLCLDLGGGDRGPYT